MFDDATLEEVYTDLLIHGVMPPEPIKFRPLTLFCRKPAGLQLGVQVGRKSGLSWLSQVKYSSAVITSLSTTFWVMAAASLEQFLICFWYRR